MTTRRHEIDHSNNAAPVQDNRTDSCAEAETPPVPAIRAAHVKRHSRSLLAAVRFPTRNFVPTRRITVLLDASVRAEVTASNFRVDFYRTEGWPESGWVEGNRVTLSPTLVEITKGTQLHHPERGFQPGEQKESSVSAGKKRGRRQLTGDQLSTDGRSADRLDGSF